MTTREPENGAYVAVDDRDNIWGYRRDDNTASDLRPQDRHRRWILQAPAESSPYAPDWALSWDELIKVGPVAYVGVFVDRSGKEGA